MDKKTSLFGQDISLMKKTCVFCPFINREILSFWNIKKLHRGFPYSSGNNYDVTLVHTKVGASFVGDAVLYLKDSPCERFILFGSCGSVQSKGGPKHGELVIAAESVALESFSDLLTDKTGGNPVGRADRSLLAEFRGKNKEAVIREVNCASVGSVYLESKYREYFIKEGVEVVDMESAAFYLAAEHVKRPALALLYVTDVLGEDDPFKKQSLRHQAIKSLNLSSRDKLNSTT